MPSDFEYKKPGTAGSTKAHLYTFGVSREKYKKVYLPHKKEAVDSEALPGPGTYTNKFMTLGTEGKRWNF